MYVWRGKNRRDKRNLLLLGETFWGASKGAEDHEAEDAALTIDLEQKHIDYYAVKVKAMMEMYLTNPEGNNEVDLLIDEMKKAAATAANFVNVDEIEQFKRDDTKVTVRDLFLKYSLPGAEEYINSEGLKNLFSDLQMTMSKKQFLKYVKMLNIEEKHSAVEFESFYEGEKMLCTLEI